MVFSWRLFWKSEVNMNDKILDALKKLDVENANHWTTDGLPRLETVRMLAGNQSITREQVSLAAPGFTRTTAGFAAAVEPADSVETEEATESEPVPDSAPSAPEPAPEPEPVAPTGDETLRFELTKQERVVQDLRMRIAQMQVEFNKQRQIEDDLRARFNASIPQQKAGEAIQGYLAAQRAALKRRYDRKAELRAKGVEVEDLKSLMKSPIDEAMARKGKGKRPTRV